jgi:ribonuclease R
MAAKRSPATLPTKQDILTFITDNKGAVGKREIARAFGIRGSDKIYLKQLLKELDADGEIERGRGRRLAKSGILPPVGVVEVSDVDEDGTLFGRPTTWRQAEAPPRIRILPGRRVTSALGIGDRVLARLEEAGRNRYDAHVMRRLEAAPSAILGTYQTVGTDGRIAPADRRAKQEYAVRRENAGQAQSGDVVLAEPLPGRSLRLREAKVTEILGDLKSPSTLSTIALHKHGIPTEFPADSLAEAAAMRPTRLGAREDLRGLALVTIDPRDARDHDDAVWAMADETADNPGGWRLIVAIADVGQFVRPGLALDREARRRGNSVYLPDRVVPMLPEALSNDLCSLKAGRSRPVLACHMRIDRDGQKIAHHFTRAYMRSAAALTYAQAQAAQDGKPDAATEPLLDSVIAPLYGAYQALQQARDRRSPLALDMPERWVALNDDGSIAEIRVRERLDSHRLIEEFMILANVAAARR